MYSMACKSLPTYMHQPKNCKKNIGEKDRFGAWKKNTIWAKQAIKFLFLDNIKVLWD